MTAVPRPISLERTPFQARAVMRNYGIHAAHAPNRTRKRFEHRVCRAACARHGRLEQRERLGPPPQRTLKNRTGQSPWGPLAGAGQALIAVHASAAKTPQYLYAAGMLDTRRT